MPRAYEVSMFPNRKPLTHLTGTLFPKTSLSATCKKRLERRLSHSKKSEHFFSPLHLPRRPAPAPTQHGPSNEPTYFHPLPPTYPPPPQSLKAYLFGGSTCGEGERAGYEIISKNDYSLRTCGQSRSMRHERSIGSSGSWKRKCSLTKRSSVSLSMPFGFGSYVFEPASG